MATRLYLDAAASATGISPTKDAAWEAEVSAGFARAVTATTKSGDALATVSHADSDVTDQDICWRQYVSAALTAGQTITGTQEILSVCRVSEVSSSNNMFFVLGIRVIAADGTTVQKTVMPVTRDDTEAPSALTGRKIVAASAATNYTTVAGDRLVIEIGMGGDPGGFGAPDHDSSMRLGSNSGSDLTVDGETNDYNPWVELTDTLTFVSAAVSRGYAYIGPLALATP